MESPEFSRHITAAQISKVEFDGLLGERIEQPHVEHPDITVDYDLVLGNGAEVLLLDERRKRFQRELDEGRDISADVSYSLDIPSETWRQKRLCKNKERMMNDSARTSKAKALCRTCNVLGECLRDDFLNGPAEGVRGALTKTQRLELYKELPKPKSQLAE